MTDQPPSDSGPDAGDTPNEILAAAKEHKAVAGTTPGKSKNWPLAKIGLAAGIGSAAIAGAILFAGRQKDRT